MGKEADKSNICAALARRVFEDPMQRREHSRLKVGSPLFLPSLDIQMNSGHLVSWQMR